MSTVRGGSSVASGKAEAHSVVGSQERRWYLGGPELMGSNRYSNSVAKESFFNCLFI